MKWIWSRLKGMWLIIHSPQEALVRNQEGPSFLVPLVVLSLVYAALTMIQAPIQLEWMQRQMLSAGAPAAQAATGLEMARRSTSFALISAPALLMLRWLAHALLLWLVAQVFLVGLSFSKTLTVVAYAYVPIILRDVTICVILCLRDREMLMQTEGLTVALGLNLVLPQLPLPWWILAGNINPFEVWFIALLAVGFSALGRVRWEKSLVVVFPVWMFVTLVQFGFTVLGHQLKNQLVRG